jgi:hypothetical protein
MFNRLLELINSKNNEDDFLDDNLIMYGDCGDWLNK